MLGAVFEFNEKSFPLTPETVNEPPPTTIVEETIPPFSDNRWIVLIVESGN